MATINRLPLIVLGLTLIATNVLAQSTISLRKDDMVI